LNIIYEDYAYSEDYKLWAETAKLNGGFYIDSQPLVYRRTVDTKISRNRRIEQLQTISKIKKEILNSLCNKYHETYPALTTLYNSYYELFEQKMIPENEIFSLFYSLFIKNKDRIRN